LTDKKIFYGWWVLVGCFFFSLYVGGVIVYGFTAVFEPIADEFGWSYTKISLAASLRGLEIGLLAPLLGILVDRLGPRKLVFAGSIITGLGLLLLSRVTTLGMFYGAFVIIAIGMSPAGGTVMLASVGNWFRKKIALVTGIAASGFALGGILVPFINMALTAYGWRQVMLGVGVGMWIVGIPLSLLLRHKPEQYGYLLDGEEHITDVTNEAPVLPQNDDIDISIKQILSSSIFWRIAVLFIFQMVAVSAVVTHSMPYLSTSGIDRFTSSLIAGALPIVSISGRLGFGWIGDRYSKKAVTVMGFAITTIGLLLFNFAAAGIWLAVLFLIMFGVGSGGNVVMRPTLLRDYFGRQKFGTFYGIATGVVMLGNVTGAPLAGWVYDTWQNYRYAWLGFAFLGVVGILILLTLPSVSTFRADLDRARMNSYRGEA
jgi:OFA family oxalate/formate antiporter-like MFS transporter